MNTVKNFLRICVLLCVFCTFSFVAPAAISSDSCRYQWKDSAGKYIDLEFCGKKVLRYMYEHNISTEDERIQTYKPFYHVFDLEGEKLITKGAGGRYTHQRGIFQGWKKVSHKDSVYDFWHMKVLEEDGVNVKGKKDKGVDQVHVKMLDKSVSPDNASLTSQIDWINNKGTVIIREVRQVTVSKDVKSGLVVIDVNTSLNAVDGDVKLDGSSNAGLQYRASNAVFESEQPADKAVYLYSKAGLNITKQRLTNMPWVAMTYGFNGKKYTVEHMNSNTNPKPYEYSAFRDYGRFGSFSKHVVQSGDTLQLSWRIIVEENDSPKREQMQKRYENFISDGK